MLIEQDVSLGLAKAVEVRHDKPRKTTASIVLFVAFILAFLLFLGLSHFNDPLPPAGFVVQAYTISVTGVEGVGFVPATCASPKSRLSRRQLILINGPDRLAAEC